MASSTAPTGGFTLTAHLGDFKTLLAFDFTSPPEKLAGFSIQVQPKGEPAYFLWNTLQLAAAPDKDDRYPNEPAQATLYAPIQKFRWLHVPGQFHQGEDPATGEYTYTVTPRLFDDQGRLQKLDATLGASVVVDVAPFRKGPLSLGFTRGFTQSQAFAHHFGANAPLRPKGSELLFKTDQDAGKNAKGETFTYAQEYAWSGGTARTLVMGFLKAVLADPAQYLDAFCYDLNEPDVCAQMLALARQGRIRMLLDDAPLHKGRKDKAGVEKPSPEDLFEQAFNEVKTGAAQLLRGHFARFAHDKVFVAFTKDKVLRVLTGSTNFSITGMYVNSNHVLVFDDAGVAAKYGGLFQAVWEGQAKRGAYLATDFATTRFEPAVAGLQRMQITFAPHSAQVATQILQDVAQRVQEEASQARNRSVLFAVMELAKSESPVLDVLKQLPQQREVFTYGITDSNDMDADESGYRLYKPGSTTGVIVSGKPGHAVLPPPFDQIHFVEGIGHQIHHKFVVCGFNGPDPTVYCGSSNLAVGGESSNGDNLLEIHDAGVAAVFAIEAVGLIDHFLYLNVLARKQSAGKKEAVSMVPTDPSKAAKDAGWHLAADDAWATRYFDPQDLKCVERQLFAQEYRGA